jgi:3-deoxy-D-manno-octulosonic-acid transferase
MPHTPLLYRCAVALARGAAPLYARFDPKFREGLLGRRGLLERLREWSAAARDPDRPLLWMHAPSVGEGLQAEVVLQALRRAHPAWQVAYTFFSPSAEPLARRQPADIVDYLPWDRRQDVQIALDALRPRALIFSKVDLWPELATRAAAGGTAVGMIAATVSPGSSRLRWPARSALRAGYQSVRAAGAVSVPDADRLVRLGVAPSRIEVTGDPRYDSAVERIRTVSADDPRLRLVRSAPTLVAGSTWPADEDVLLSAFRAVRAAHPEARLLVVPHEPTGVHLARLRARARELELPEPLRLESADQASPLMVEDRVGGLAELYVGATIAYVGGGFGDAGLHSVVEPAACSIPVLFGPRWENSRDAGLLLTRRAAIAVSEEFPDWLDLDSASTHAGANPLAAIWLGMLRHPAHAAAAGRRARDFVEAGLGAAARSAGLIQKLMLDSPAPGVTPRSRL